MTNAVTAVVRESAIEAVWAMDLVMVQGVEEADNVGEARSAAGNAERCEVRCDETSSTELN